MRDMLSICAGKIGLIFVSLSVIINVAFLVVIQLHDVHHDVAEYLVPYSLK